MGEMKRFFSLMMAVILLMCAAVPAAAEEGAEIISPSARINFRSSAQNTKNVGNNGMGGLLTDVVIVDENGNNVTGRLRSGRNTRSSSILKRTAKTSSLSKAN